MKHHAVVVGAGIGGLLAAQVLAPRFERVTLLERHALDASGAAAAPAARRGAPQSRCLHLLMGAGVAAFDELLPRWREDLVARGALPFDASADAVLQTSGGRWPRVASGIMLYACSRSLVEQTLRAALAAHAHVQVLQAHKVLGLLGGGERVSGVLTGVPDAAGNTPRTAELAADLVVDAGGADSALSEWLCRLDGREPIAQTRVESGRQYVSRWFHLDAAAAPDWHCLSIASDPHAGQRAAMMLRAERDFWGVVLLAPDGQPLPDDDDGFAAFGAALAGGELRAALHRATPASPIHRYGATYSRLRHYERDPAWPQGLVALGDSACALDPYAGLGMTAAARGVRLLRDFLDAALHRAGGCADFQRELARLNAAPWELATGCDVQGRPVRRDSALMRRLQAAAPGDPALSLALLAVQHLLRPPGSLAQLAPA